MPIRLGYPNLAQNLVTFSLGCMKYMERLFLLILSLFQLPIFGNRPEDVQKWIDSSLEKLQVSQIDLYLFHVPFGAFLVDGKFVPDNSTDIIAVWKVPTFERHLRFYFI